MALRPRPLTVLAACLGASLTTAAAVRAQSFVGIGPVRSFVLPTEPRGEPQPQPASIAPPPAPRPVALPDDGLRRLPATLAGFRFSGEWAETVWPLALTAAQAAAPARLRLAILSAISVMPEGSRLSVTLNDTPLGGAGLAPPDAVAIREFSVPAGVLKPGSNALRIRVEQRHRVDCSPAATYELWTAIDPARSGLLLAGEAARAGYVSSQDIAAVAPRGDGAFAIQIAVAGKLTPEMAGRAVKAAQIAALASGSLHPVVSLATGEPEPGGLVVALGLGEDLRARPDLGDPGPVFEPRHGFAQTASRPVFRVTGKTAADLDIALARWEAERRAASPIGSEAGLRAAARQPGHAASGLSERVALKQTGFEGASFSGRLFRLGVDIAMPMDFLPADYDRMTLNLAGSHAAGLGRDAHILVTVNGRTAATQNLRGAAQGDLERNQIFLPLSLMRPGQNRLEVVAEVATPADAACRAGDAPRLTLLDRSELVLPRVARVGRAPELALTAAGGFPFSREGARPVLYVPNPDRQTMGAALTLAARLAVAAGRPLDFAFTVTPPPPEAGPVLAVSPAQSFDPALLKGAGVDPSALEAAWRPLAGRRRPAQPAMHEADQLAARCSLPRIDPGLAEQARADGGEPSEGKIAFAGLGLRASLPAIPFWRAPPEPGSVTEAEVVARRSLLVVAQDYPSERAAEAWTIVTAPDAALLAAGVACLAHPALWGRLAGRLAGLRGDESLVSAPAGERQRHLATQAFSVPNLRLVAAGWLSLNPLAYVALALALVLGLALSTLWLVVNTGRRQE